MLAKTPISDRFIDWVAAQPANDRYDWTLPGHCACGRFLREELGCTLDEVAREYTARHVDPEACSSVELWNQFDLLAAGRSKEDWTFGKLHKRINRGQRHHD
jgi:hypothetical protein